MAKNKGKTVSPHADDETVVYKVMAAVAAACAGVCAFIRVKAAYAKAGSMLAVSRGLLVALIAAAVLAAVCIGAAVLLRRRKALRYVFGFAAALGILTAVSCAALRAYWVSAATACYYLWIAAALLYSLYLLYQREFFVIALLTAAAGGTFYLLSHSVRSTGAIAATAVLVALGVLTAIVTFLTARSGGCLTLGKKKLSVFPAGFAPLPLYLTAVLWPLCALCALIVGSAFAYYCIYAAVGGALVAVCYYTIKLM